MATRDRGLPREGGARSASSLDAVSDYAVVVRKTGEALLRLHQLVLTRVCADDEIELAEEINDSLKPALDWLAHYEVSRGQ